MLYINLIFASLLIVTCVHSQPDSLQREYVNPDGIAVDEQVVQANNGMVVTAHPAASKAAVDVLKKGGNAIDAFVAASFAISVVRPQSTGIGGGGFLLYYDKAKDQTRVYDFRERAPKKAGKRMYIDTEGKPISFTYKGSTLENASINGHLAVGIPGLVAGLHEVHLQHGSLKFAELLEEPIRLAEEGFPVYKNLENAIIWRQEVLSAFDDSKRLFLPKGEPLKSGQILVQKDLAKTLRIIADKGKAGFYSGDVAASIIAEMQRGKGILSAHDLANYQMKERQPILGTYKGYKIVSMPPPSSGGIHIVQMLNMLEGESLISMEHNSAEYVHLITEVMRRAFADRAQYLGDDDFVDVPKKGLISKEYAQALFRTINRSRATPSSEVSAGDPLPYESNSTTHISIVDRYGNAVSSTQTINYAFGSGVVAKGTGIVLNNEMDDFSISPGVPNVFGLLGGEANAVAAGKTMLSSMSPTLVFEPNGELKLVVGSPGGPRIINATFQTILNVLEFNMPLRQAVHNYRFHHQWYPDEIRIEPGGLTTSTMSKLEGMGHKVVEKSFPIGDVQAIHRISGRLVGVSDSRSDGKPMGY